MLCLFFVVFFLSSFARSLVGVVFVVLGCVARELTRSCQQCLKRRRGHYKSPVTWYNML